MLFIALAFGQADPNRIIATINGEDVKGAEFYRRMEHLSGVGRMIGNSFIEETPGFWTVEQIATEKLVFGLAKEKGALATDAEVQAELRDRLTLAPTLLQEWTATGQTQADLEHLIRYQLTQFKLQTNGITVTNLEIDKFYKDNQFTYTIPKRVKLRVIVVSDPVKKAQIDVQLQSKPFPEVAKAMSEDVSKSNGGEFGTVPLNSLTEAIRRPIEATKIGQTTSWIEAGGQHIRFLVEDIIPEKLQPLDDNLRKSIRRKLRMDRGRIKNDVTKDMNAFRAKSKIDIKNPKLAESYARMMKRFGNTQ